MCEGLIQLTLKIWMEKTKIFITFFKWHLETKHLRRNLEINVYHILLLVQQQNIEI